MSTDPSTQTASTAENHQDLETGVQNKPSKEEARQKTQDMIEAQYDMAAKQTHDAYSGYDPFDADTNGLSSRDQVILRDVYRHFKALKYIILCAFITYICSFFEIAIIIFPILGIYYCERVNIKGAIYYLVYSVLSLIAYVYFFFFTNQYWSDYCGFFGTLTFLPYYYLVLASLSIAIHIVYVILFVKFITVYKKLNEKVKPVLYNLRDLYK